MLDLLQSLIDLVGHATELKHAIDTCGKIKLKMKHKNGRSVRSDRYDNILVLHDTRLCQII